MGIFKKKKELPHIYIGCPVHEGVSSHFVGSLYNLMLTNGRKLRYDFAFDGSGSIATSRDKLAKLTLEVPTAQGVVMIDDDMKWLPNFVERIVSHGKPIVGAVYSKRARNAQWCLNGIKGEEVDEKTGLLKVKEIGTGFIYIAREVFEAMIERFPQIAYPTVHPGNGAVQTTMWNFFFQGVKQQVNQEGVMAPRFLGEDYGFCHLARECGFEIYADTQLIIPHTGKIDYPLADDPRVMALADAKEKTAA